MASIEVEGLSKVYLYYKKKVGLKNSFHDLFFRETLYKEAVKGISFAIDEGEMVGFIGPNGAGKTTTLKMLSGILYPTGGKASVIGYTPWERKDEFKRQISIVMGQKNQLWWDLPASESFYLNKYIYEIEENKFKSRLEELCELLDVKDLLNIQVRRLSLGERMKMELIAALLHDPQIILLDEPTIGLDIVSQQKLREFLKYYNEQFKTTILLTSHYINDIQELCNRAIIINHGTIVYDGSLKKINDSFNSVKILKVKFDHVISREQIQKYGKIIEYDGIQIVLEVEKTEINGISKKILNDYQPLDFNIEDIPLEQSISLIYQAGDKNYDKIE